MISWLLALPASSQVPYELLALVYFAFKLKINLHGHYWLYITYGLLIIKMISSLFNSLSWNIQFKTTELLRFGTLGWFLAQIVYAKKFAFTFTSRYDGAFKRVDSYCRQDRFKGLSTVKSRLHQVDCAMQGVSLSDGLGKYFVAEVCRPR